MSCIDVVEAAGRFAIFGLIGLPHEVGSSVLGHRVIAADKDLDEFLHRCDTAFVAVGQIKSPDLRMRLFRKLVAGGCTLPVVVSPQARVSKYADVGQGTIIMHGVIIVTFRRTPCSTAMFVSASVRLSAAAQRFASLSSWVTPASSGWAFAC
jgi:hypothetical protein